MSSYTDDRRCLTCGDTEEQAHLERCLVCGKWFCPDCAFKRTGRELGEHDYGGLVWDEVVAFMMVLVFVPMTWIAYGCRW